MSSNAKYLTIYCDWHFIHSLLLRVALAWFSLKWIRNTRQNEPNEVTVSVCWSCRSGKRVTLIGQWNNNQRWKRRDFPRCSISVVYIIPYFPSRETFHSLFNPAFFSGGQKREWIWDGSFDGSWFIVINCSMIDDGEAHMEKKRSSYSRS